MYWFTMQNFKIRRAIKQSLLGLLSRKMQKLFILSLLFSGCVENILGQNPTLLVDTYLAGFTRPTDIESAGDARLFVAEIGGKIKIIQNDTILPTPFLDIADKMNNVEFGGIFSFAFDPGYAQNGKFYVMYIRKPDAQVQVSQFARSITNPDQADPTEYPIITIPYNFPNGHRGGEIAFGADGFLYITTGDNATGGRGAIGDPTNNAQNLGLLFGKILRIDVNHDALYSVPADNPYQIANDNIPDEIWARGLRNPWRMSFDKLTGDMWLGDNGQDGWDEVDFQAANAAGGANYGWRCYEGNHRYLPQTTCDSVGSMTFPLHEYAGFDNNGGNRASVMGGFVYRGLLHPSLYGHYVYGDYASGKIWTLKRHADGAYTNVLQTPNIPNLVTFGQGSDGELFAASFQGGQLYKIKTNNCPATLTLTAPLDGVQNHYASNQIEGLNTIQLGANIIYQAGQSVLLSPGFRAEAGSIFKAIVAGCP